MNFSVLLDRAVADVWLKNKIIFLCEKNRQAVKDKKNELVSSDEIINQFILESINSIMSYLKDNEYNSDCLCI